MSEEILVNCTPQEMRVAQVDNGVLQDVVIERAAKRGSVGNIYLGEVSRVLPGMGAAFLDIGMSRTAFLHVSDVVVPIAEYSNGGDQDLAIEQILREGQRLLVQITKDPLGSKGARLTTHLSIPSRYLVFLPNMDSVGVSQRIDNEPERARLREIITRLKSDWEICNEHGATVTAGNDDATPSRNKPGSGGFIIRTAAEGIFEDRLALDMGFLRRLWAAVENRISRVKQPGSVYEDLPLILRTLRDLSVFDTEKMRIDSKEFYGQAIEFAKSFVPDMVSLIEHYSGSQPIFDVYGIEQELQKALENRVELKSGGYLIIDQTEAMTTIDVNTGAFVGHRNLEETIFKTNLEASQSIARQLRLRNLGGIIIVDFIDMKDPDHQHQVHRSLEKNLGRDPTKVSLSEVTSLGLVQITRKRTRESLGRVLCVPCPICKGRGVIKSVETVCNEIFREILREVRQFEVQKLLLVASQEVVDRLLNEDSSAIADLEEFVGKSIKIQADALYTQEQYDVVLL